MVMPLFLVERAAARAPFFLYGKKKRKSKGEAGFVSDFREIQVHSNAIPIQGQSFPEACAGGRGRPALRI
jgi:hypothetical protein